MTTTADLDSPTGVLDAVRDVHASITELEIDKFRLAVEWAVMHPRRVDLEGRDGRRHRV
ncbi:hypothetical protein ABLE68_02835 [Nocardioides sp. CN2-186]|uniref:hypothetical protein n=1 Tax=Nocardioides tweenelious TaxID=3156607 RepID=UPI0032B340AC